MANIATKPAFIAQPTVPKPHFSQFQPKSYYAHGGSAVNAVVDKWHYLPADLSLHASAPPHPTRQP